MTSYVYLSLRHSCRDTTYVSVLSRTDSSEGRESVVSRDSFECIGSGLKWGCSTWGSSVRHFDSTRYPPTTQTSVKEEGSDSSKDRGTVQIPGGRSRGVPLFLVKVKQHVVEHLGP